MSDQNENVNTSEEPPVPMPQTAKRGKKAPPATTPAPKPESFIQLWGKNGEVIFTSTVPKPDGFYRTERDKVMITHLPDILRAAIDEGIKPSDIDFSDNNLGGIDLRNMNLDGIDFSSCNFGEADLRHTSLRGANLSDCHFEGARMTGADLTGANLDDTSFAQVEARHIEGLILLCELNDWYVYGYRNSRGELRIRAGCRDFNLEDARDHWIGAAGREEIVAALTLMEVIAKNRGWRTTTAEEVPATPAVAQKLDENDFEDEEDDL